jgi:TM2 domain-containing membrane protein YozV
MRRTVLGSYYPPSKSIAFGAIGGFVAGLVMAPFLMISGVLAGMPANTMPMAIGLVFGAANKDNAITVGFGMHMLTSVIIGVIFGVIIAKIHILRITGFAKGIIEGLIIGMIAFVILFIPISMSIMPPVLMKIAMQMNPTMAQQQIMNMMQQKMPMMFGIGFLEHLVYGAVLGAVTTALLLKVGRKRETQVKEKEEWK